MTGTKIPDETPFNDLPEDPLEATLRAGFTPEPTDAPQMGNSVIASLKARIGLESRVMLKDPLASTPSTKEKHLATPSKSEYSRYKVLGEIARGGLGVVMKGRDVDLGREVAVKLLPESHAVDSEMVLRLLEEAQVGGQLQHPGIVPVYDIGLRADDKPFFTMKLVNGETLAALLGARVTPDEDRIRFLRIFEQVCQTIAYAHARGVIHRDLKPSNIMVGDFGEVQVMDWGLAKVLRHGESKGAGREAKDVPLEPLETIRTAEGDQSQAGSVMGTFAYMAPEQARGEVGRLDERCDVFGLGTILCEILTGKPAFVGETSEQVMHMARDGILDDCWLRLESSKAESKLVQLARKCLAPRMTDRLHDAGKVAGEIEAYLAAVAERARRSELEAAENRVRAEEAEARMVQERRARKLSVTLAATVMCAVIIVAAGYTWFKNLQRDRIQETTERVNTAMAQAALFREAARTSGFEVPDAWEKALEKGCYAADLMGTAAVSPRTRTRVQSFLAEVKREAARAEADQGMLRRLEEIRIQVGEDWDWKAMDEAYAAAFRGYDIDVNRLAAGDAAALIAKSHISRELISGIDEWISGRVRVGEDAEKLYHAAQLADPDPWRDELRRARIKKERAKIRQLITSKNPDELSPADTNDVGRTLSHLDKESGVSFYRKMARKYPDDFWINFNLGWILSQMGPLRLREGIRYSYAAVVVRPNSGPAWSNLGLALMRDGKKAEAQEAFLKALELNPDDPITLTSYGLFLHSRMGEYDKAIRFIEKSLKIDSRRAKTHAALGDAWFVKGDHEKARTCYQRAIEINPNQEDVLGNMGVLCMFKGDFPGAIEYIENALQINPQNGINHFNLGVSLESIEKSDAAIEAYRMAVLYASDIAEAHINLGGLLEERGNVDEALIHYEKALELPSKQTYVEDKSKSDQEGRPIVTTASTHTVAMTKLGRAYHGLNRLDEAHAILTKALVEAPSSDPVPRYYLGLICIKRGELDRAKKYFEEALEIDPKYTNARIELEKLDF